MTEEEEKIQEEILQEQWQEEQWQEEQLMYEVRIQNYNFDYGDVKY